MDAPTIDSILRELLARFPIYLDNAWHDLDEGHGYFGDGSNGENGIRSNANVAFAAASIVSRAATLTCTPTQIERLLQRARAVMRYLCRAHVTASGRCANGRRWGLEWQSAWWAAKLGLAAWTLGARIDEGERLDVERVVVAEADRQLGRIVPTGLHLDTKAEENAWDAEVLAVALALCPTHEHAAVWREKVIEFSANVFSSPHDPSDESLLDGKPVRERVYTCNVHGDYSLENHGSYHFCYVASPLLSKAWCAFALRSADQPLPESLRHHVGDVWALAEHTFLDGRFAYVSGQDWARYTYGEYFIVPALVYLRRELRDERCAAILYRRLQLLRDESRDNADGSFFGSRFTARRFGGQYGKYETDCFACVALAWSLWWLDGVPDAPVALEPPVPFRHISPQGQFCFQRTGACFFSFSWNTLEDSVPNLCLIPHGHDDLAEWHAGNLLGQVSMEGLRQTIGVRAMKAVEGGIEINGSCLVRGPRGKALFEHVLSIRFDALDATVTICSRFVARKALHRVAVTGVNWRIPNDRFNGHQRTLHEESGMRYLTTTQAQRDPTLNRDRRTLFRRVVDRLRRSIGRDRSQLEMVGSNWINIDDAIGLVVPAGVSLGIRRYPGRQSAEGSLYVEQVESPVRRFWPVCRAGQVMLDSRVVVHVGTAAETASIARRMAA
jgi:hypothetical protein